MSKSTVLLLDPTAIARVSGSRLAERPTDIGGATVGFVDNGWWSFGVFIERYRQLLTERFRIREVVHYKKKPTGPSPSEVVEEMASKCQVVVSGLGN